MVTGLVDFSIYYYKKTDTLMAFGGVFLADSKYDKGKALTF